MKAKINSIEYKKWHVILLVILLSITLGISAYYINNNGEQSIRQNKNDELRSISELKIKQILLWKKERLGDANVISKIPFIRSSIEQLNIQTNSYKLQKDFRDFFESIATRFDYENILFASINGNLLLSLDSSVAKIDSFTSAHIYEAVKKNNTIFTELYNNEIEHNININIITPIHSKDGKVIAVIVFQINPDDYLYPLIQSWPTASKTAETLMIRKDNDSVLFVNELRFLKNAALNLRIPLNRKDVPAVQAVLGFKGIWEGKDYRNADVLSFISPVPGTNWFMIAKIDKSEIYSDLYTREIFIAVITLVLILLLTIGIILSVSLRQKNTYKKLFQIGKNLHAVENEFRTTLYSIGDGVITADETGKIKQMNNVAEKLTGWNEGKASGKHISSVYKVINEITRQEFKSPVERVIQSGLMTGIANHTLLINKGGKEIPISDSAAPIKNDADEVIGIVLVFSDQTVERNNLRTLEESEKRFRLLYESSPISYQSLDSDGRLIDVNPAWLDVLGYTRDEVIGKYFGDFMTPKSAQSANESFIHFKKIGEVLNAEYEMVRKDGEKIFVSYNGKIGKDEFGNFKQTHCVFSDITEQKIAEEKLKNERILLRTVIDNLPDAIYVKDKFCKKKLANLADLHNLGLQNESDIIDKDDFDFYPKEIAESFFADDQSLLLTGRAIINREEFYPDKEGKKHWLSTSKVPLKDEDENIIGIVGIGRDITEQKTAEKEITMLAHSLRSINECVSITDLKDNIIFLNETFLKTYGYSEIELIGKNMSIVRSLKNPPEVVNEILPATLKDGWNGELWNKRKDGSEFQVYLSTTTVKDKNDNVLGLIGVAIDITESRKLELNLANAAEIAKLGYWEYDVDSGEFLFNDQYYRLIHGSSTEKQGGNIMSAKEFASRLVYPDDSNIVGRNLQDAIESPDPDYFCEIEARVFRDDGDVANVSVQFRALKDNSGHTYRIYGVNQDITKRKKDEESILKLSRAIEQSPTLIVITDQEGIIEYVNEKFCRTTGYSNEEVIGKNPSMLKSGFQDKNFYKNLWDTILSGKEWKGELQNKKKNGDIYWESSIISPLVNNKGEVTNFISIKEDITKQKQTNLELLISQERYKSIFDNSVELIYIFDLQGNLLEINNKALTLFGYTSAETKNLNISDILDQNDLPTAKKNIAYVIANGANKDLQTYRVTTKTGEEVFIETTGVRLDKEGKPYAIMGIARDVTDRKLAEKELVASEDRYRLLFESAAEGILVVDVETKVFKLVNKAICKMLGYTKQEMTGLSVKDIHPPESLSYVISEFKLQTQGEKSLSMDIPCLRKDGTIFYTNIFNAIVYIDNRKHLIAFFTDITAQKEASKKIKLFRTLIDHSNDAVEFIDLETGRFLDCNENAFQELGYTREEFLTLKLYDVDPTLTEDSFPERKKLIRDSGSLLIEGIHRRKDGTEFPVEINIKLVELESDYVVAAVRNITDRKLYEQELIKAKEEAEELNRLKSSFLSNMSHELRTPLIGILGYAEFLENELKDTELFEMANIIKISGKRLNKTLNDILDISKIESENQKIEFMELDLVKYLNEQTDLFRIAAEEKKLSFNFETREIKLNAYVDERLFVSIIANLLNNAIKYTAKGSITINARKEEDQAVIEIKDTGVGVEEDLQEIIFEPFRQASEGFSRKFEGSGLGLSLVKKYTDIMNGTIALQSKPGVGSTFTLRLPINKSAAEKFISTNWI
jgi:PAS domain S-box-containing protein